VERVFGEQAEVQRCRIHKRRNVKEDLPENCEKDYDRRIRNAFAMNDYADAKAALEKILRPFQKINPSAARSLQEGLEAPFVTIRRRESPGACGAWQRPYSPQVQNLQVQYGGFPLAFG